MRADEFASRLESLSIASKDAKPQLAETIKEDLSTLEPLALGELLCLCANILQPKSLARTANRMLLRALESKKDQLATTGSLTVEKLICAGASMCTLVQIASCFPLGDLPPEPKLTEELVAILLAWQPSSFDAEVISRGSDATTSSPMLLLLSAVKQFYLAALLPESTAEALFRHAVECEQKHLTSKKIIEAGESIPEWRSIILRFLFSDDASDISRIHASDLVRIAQRWGAHEDSEIFLKLRDLIATELVAKESTKSLCPSDETYEIDMKNTGESKLPRLQLAAENVILLDGRVEMNSKLAQSVEIAKTRLNEGGNLWVALDAEWEDPRPISLLQLALCNGEVEDVEVFLFDALVSHTSAVLENVRWLLRGGAKSGAGESAGSRHEVLVFGAHEDKRRLGVSGLLPEFSQVGFKNPVDPEFDRQMGWIDLQNFGDWGLGAQPSLRSVVAKELVAFLDKSLQQSNWDHRPLSDEHIQYAALDSSVLLRLRARCHNLGSKAISTVKAHAKKIAPSTLSLDEERAKWTRYRCERNSDENEFSDLRFVLPASLTKLMRKMRGLGLDTVILEEGSPQQNLARVALAEDRIILTRSSKMQLAGEAASKVYVLRSVDTDEQIREMIDVFGVEVQVDSLCGRCIKCNSPDWRFASREDVKDHPDVKKKTLEAYSEFWICGGCGKVFWEGGMFEKAVAHFRTFLPDSEPAVQSALEADVCRNAGLTDQEEARDEQCIFSKYKVMVREGCSTQRIRAQMIRDGVITPSDDIPSGVIEVASTSMMTDDASR